MRFNIANLYLDTRLFFALRAQAEYDRAGGDSGLKAEYDSSWEVRGLENDRGGEKVTVWERAKILQYFAI